MANHADPRDASEVIRESAGNRLDAMSESVATATSDSVTPSFERIVGLIQWMRDQDRKEQRCDSLRKFHWHLSLVHASTAESLPDTRLEADAHA